MAQITSGIYRGHAAGDNDTEKAASQLVSDVKYKVKMRLGDGITKMSPATLMKAYMEQLAKSPPGPVRNLAQKKLTGAGMREDYNIDELVSSSVANALFKVFVEGVEKEQLALGEEYLEELMKKNKNGESLYWVKVYYKNGTTYTRWADRARMSEIRFNPNVERVEMVDTLPPENQRGKDYDGDGTIESPAKEYRGSVHNAIQRKRGGVPDGKDTSSVKEDIDYLEEKKNSKKQRKYDIMRGKKNNNRIKLFPEIGKSYSEQFFPESAVSIAIQKFMTMVRAYKNGEMNNASPEVKKAAKEMSDTEAKKFASTRHEGLPKHVQKEETACDSSEMQRDTRGDYSKKEVIKNKLRSALGVQNPIIITSNENDMKEGMGLSTGISNVVGNLMSNPRTPAKEAAKNFQKNVADPVGKAVKAVLSPANNSPEAQKARGDKYRPEEVELNGEVIDEEMPRTVKGPRSPGIKKPKPKKPVPDDDYDDYDYDYNNHPSLSARDRNPGLR